MAVLTAVTGAGHSTLEYDLADPAEVDKAKQEFDRLMSRGYVGYVDQKPTPVFDPTAEHTLMTPVVVGG